MTSPLIAGFLKGRNLLLRGDLWRILPHMDALCDETFYLDDSSYDGTYEIMCYYLGADHVLRVPPKEHNFADELKWKQALLDLIHNHGPFGWILWMDSDETWDAAGTTGLRAWCKANVGKSDIKGLMAHYTQLWRSTNWARTDSQFDEGNFVKLWRYEPTLKFEIQPGTHHRQFPIQFDGYLREGKVKQADWDIIHWGNMGEDLKWKCLQYYGGLGGVERHLHFENATYRPVSPKQLPEGTERWPVEEVAPFSPQQVALIEQMQDLTNLKDTFCIIVPTYNRADFLERCLNSVRAQTYEKWICVVLDDGSTDSTPYKIQEFLDLDPRFFYCRYLENLGGVARNEIGMEIAVNTAEYWTRLGSDDWWEPEKLANDQLALQRADVQAVYGLFQAYHQGQYQELGNYPVPRDLVLDGFLRQGFFAGWANVAVSTKILRKVKETFGNYCRPELRNMEDRQFNARVAMLTEWHWRGVYCTDFMIDPDPEDARRIAVDYRLVGPEAYWNKSDSGASANAGVYAYDSDLTTKFIAEDWVKVQQLRKGTK